MRSHGQSTERRARAGACDVRRLATAIGLALLLAGCAASSIALAPESPQTPWHGDQPAALADTPAVIPARPGAPPEAGPVPPAGRGPDFALPPNPALPIGIARPDIDPRHVHTLPELIDIAQMANPVTRGAWERAREAALTVGAARATYLPILTADVIAGYQRATQAVPGLEVNSQTRPGIDVTSGGVATSLIVPGGTVTAQGREVIPSLTVKWLLFDFGRRDAVVESARQLSTAANVSFNGTHQKLIFDVSRAFFALTATRVQLRVGRDSAQAARLVHEAAKARLGRGIGTTIEVAQARQQVAQADLALTQAEGQARDTYHSLLEAMGVSPTLTIQIQDISGRPLPRVFPADLNRLIEASLQRRPDVQVAFARLAASRQGIARARADFMPQVALLGTANQNISSLTVTDSRLRSSATVGVNSPNLSLLLGVSMPLYDGGLRDAQLKAAEAQAAASEQDLRQVENMAARQIVVAYDVLRTSLAAHAAATELTSAAQTTSTATLEYYRTGLGTLTDATIAQTALFQARLARAKAHSDALVAAATIAFATGTLTNRLSPSRL
ncbi:MAG: TolC family protein [Rhizobiales bacterium]|nr:TolC family protein [Hyphomicrobiales bacterium]